MLSQRPIFFPILLSACLFPGIAQAVKVEWVPVRASEAYEIHGNYIVLEHGGQRVWFEAKISGWAPELLVYYYLFISRPPFGTALPGAPHPAMPMCDSDDDCATALGYPAGCREFCNGGDRHTDACDEVPDCGAGVCERRCFPAYIDAGREDFLLVRGQRQSGLVSVSHLSYYLFGDAELSTTGLVPDDGEVKYLATFVIDVPEGWAGTFTLEFTEQAPGGPSPVGGLGRQFAVEYTAATLSIPCRLDEECDDANACTTERCDSKTGQCLIESTYDPAVTCCNPYSGALEAVLSDELQCKYNRCDPLTGVIRHLPKPYRTACGSAADTCNPPGICQAGTCGPPSTRPGRGTPCGDRNYTECSEPDTCDGAGSCVENNNPDGSLCFDGGFCNGVDECRSGECVSVGPPICGGEDRCDEERQTCLFETLPLHSIPAHDGTLTSRNYPPIVLFAGDLSLPAEPPRVGDFDIRRLLPDGRVGPDFSYYCSFRLLQLGGGVGAALEVRPWGGTLAGDWYTLRHLGTWGGLPPFEIHFLVQPGDANGDGNVNAADLAAINNMIGHWDRSDPFQTRFDVRRDDRVDFADVAEANRHVPRRRIPKPSGH